MSEVIEEYIRRNTGLPQDAAFEAFLQQDRIRSWVGSDEGRRERLQREFTRVWQTVHTGAAAERAPVEKPRSGPARDAVQVELRRPAASPASPLQAPIGPGRKLHVLCPTCGKHDVFNVGGVIACRTCGHHYDNMLDLIPVKPVGPFTFLFGEGWQGAATAGGIGLALILLYLVLRF